MGKESQEITNTREKPVKEKQQPVRASIPSHLPRIEEIVEPDNIEEGPKKIGEEITEVLEYNPAKIYVHKIVRPKYARPNNEGIQIAGLPTLPIPKGNAGATWYPNLLITYHTTGRYKFLNARVLQ